MDMLEATLIEMDSLVESFQSLVVTLEQAGSATYSDARMLKPVLVQLAQSQLVLAQKISFMGAALQVIYQGEKIPDVTEAV